MNQLYRSIGISKQAVHQYNLRQQILDKKLELLIREADQLRTEHPGCGVEKMYYTLAPNFIGRDRFIQTFMSLGYRIKKSKNYRRTTYSSASSKYLNLIEGMMLHSPNQVWQSDITYYKVEQKFYYIVFIIDVYTKKIVGFNVSDSLRAIANLKALKMAVSENGYPIIHHSDKGAQYIYSKYVELLKNNGTHISMGQTAMDNAYAERINQTIKSEYLQYWQPRNFKQLKLMTKKAVENYNRKRKHNHLKRKMPIEFEKEVIKLAPNKRPKVTIYTDGKKNWDGHRALPNFEQEALLAPNCPIR